MGQLCYKLLWVSLFATVGTSNANAQSNDGKRVMTIQDYARWRSIVSVALSDNGEWMTYAYRRHKSDDTLYVRKLETGREFVVPGGSQPRFSDDSRWVAYRIAMTFDEAEKLRRDKKTVPEAVGLMNLQSGETVEWKKVATFVFVDGSAFLAINRDLPDDDVEHNGADLILRHLEGGMDEMIGNVAEFAFNDSGAQLAYTIDAEGRLGNGLHLYDLAAGTRRVLDSDTLRYAKLTWSESGTALAVLKGLTPEGKDERKNVLLAFKGIGGTIERTELDPDALPDGMVLSEHGTLTWSEDLSRVFFGSRLQQTEFEEDEDNPIANVDIFHWNDDRIQTVQEQSAKRDENFTFRYAFQVDDERIVALTDSTMRTIQLTEDGAWGVGRDDRAYRSDWKEPRADYYRVNTATGDRAFMLEGQGRTLGLSPDGRHFLYWADGHIWDYRMEDGQRRNLTGSAPVSFVNEQYDRQGTKPPHGVAGWTEDGEYVILNGRYDLWLQPLGGDPATALTKGRGAEGEVRLRYVRLDPDEEFIDLSEPVVLSAYGDWTKRYGYFMLDDGEVEERAWGDFRVTQIRKAQHADRVVFARETFVEFPNWHVTDMEMSETEQITDANPWQGEYAWGTNVLFEYENKDGVRLQGALSIPDSYEPGQPLPMLVDFYEKRSQALFQYSRLVFRDTPMFAKYVSQGYLVMQPDVHFNGGTTHDDMLDAVEAATRKVVEMGYADPDRIGLHGHSFSGGGASFIATRSNMFAAIVAGAAPINLAGEFDILFHGSGQNNHSYDIYGQGWYGTNPFDDFELYRSQSPITWVQTMDTPLLYLHGTEDGSVEYLQGMEFYNALRFLGKPIIFASYPGEGHHLAKLENQIDFMTRMEQFYAHYLKGEPAPEWMVGGVPFLRKKQAARALVTKPVP